MSAMGEIGTPVAGAATYGTLAHVARQGLKPVWVMDGIPPHVAIRLKHLFPRLPKGQTAPFHFPDTDEAAADLAWFLMRYPMALDPAHRAALDERRARFEAQRAELEAITREGWQAGTARAFLDGKALRRYQQQAVEILARRRSLLLGDEVGLGKTVSALGALLLDEALPAVIVVPGYLQGQWQASIEAFTGLWCHAVKTTKAEELPVADVYLFRYSNIAGWVDVIAAATVGLAAFDEIQELRTGPEVTQKGQACSALARRARYRLGLTATPIYNWGREIHAVMRFIDPAVLGSFEDFFREWTSGGHIADPVALGSYLREQHVFLRRTRSDVGRELPPVNRIVSEVEANASPLAEIEAMARDLARVATIGSFTERGQARRELDARVRHATGLAKAVGVARYVRVLLEAGEPVVLIGWHRDVYEIWRRDLARYRPAFYTGSESMRQKTDAVEAFTSGATDLFIMSLRSGAGIEGLQERARTVVFGELDWSPGIHHQIIGRLDRERADGTLEQVLAIFLVTDDGSDPPMMETLGLKAAESTAIVDPGLGVQAHHSDVAPIQRLVERYLERNGGRP